MDAQTAFIISGVAQIVFIMFWFKKEDKENKRHRENADMALAKMDREERQRLKAIESV